MTPADLKAARNALGLSARALGELVGYQGAPANVSKSIRRIEAGKREAPAGYALLLRLLVEVPEARALIGL